MRKIISALFLLLPLLAAAQTTISPNIIRVGPTPNVGGNASMTVTAGTASVALPASVTTYPVVMLVNKGPVEVFFAAGTSGVTASASSAAIPAGACVTFGADSQHNYVAAITAAFSSTLRISQWTGAPSFACGHADTGSPGIDGSATITTGGTAQALFGGVAPTHGFKIALPVALSSINTFICFVSDTTATPSSTTPGSYPIYAGGQYSTESGERPSGTVYLNCPTTATPFAAKSW